MITDVRAVFLAIAISGVLTAVMRADVVEIDRSSVAAIAYSPATGHYGYAFNYRSRKAAEKAALEDCGADDARIVCWVKNGFCALALGDDKTCWGTGWRYGPSCSSDETRKTALEDCGNRTTGAHIALIMTSDGQRVW